jgi:hypothetical protein
MIDTSQVSWTDTKETYSTVKGKCQNAFRSFHSENYKYRRDATSPLHPYQLYPPKFGNQYRNLSNARTNYPGRSSHCEIYHRVSIETRFLSMIKIDDSGTTNLRRPTIALKPSDIKITNNLNNLGSVHRNHSAIC